MLVVVVVVTVCGVGVSCEAGNANFPCRWFPRKVAQVLHFCLYSPSTSRMCLGYRHRMRSRSPTRPEKELLDHGRLVSFRSLDLSRCRSWWNLLSQHVPRVQPCHVSDVIEGYADTHYISNRSRSDENLLLGVRERF